MFNKKYNDIIILTQVLTYPPPIHLLKVCLHLAAWIILSCILSLPLTVFYSDYISLQSAVMKQTKQQQQNTNMSFIVNCDGDFSVALRLWNTPSWTRQRALLKHTCSFYSYCSTLYYSSVCSAFKLHLQLPSTSSKPAPLFSLCVWDGDGCSSCGT